MANKTNKSNNKSSKSNKTAHVLNLLKELNRFIGMFKLARESGYTLKLIPGTPEENAPVFNRESGKIIRPAA